MNDLGNVAVSQGTELASTYSANTLKAMNKAIAEVGTYIIWGWVKCETGIPFATSDAFAMYINGNASSSSSANTYSYVNRGVPTAAGSGLTLSMFRTFTVRSDVFISINSSRNLSGVTSGLYLLRLW